MREREDFRPGFAGRLMRRAGAAAVGAGVFRRIGA